MFSVVAQVNYVFYAAWHLFTQYRVSSVLGDLSSCICQESSIVIYNFSMAGLFQMRFLDSSVFSSSLPLKVLPVTT